MSDFTVSYPERIESEANGREHWAKKAGRVKRQRTMAWALLRNVQLPTFTGAVRVRLVRIAPRALDDDNLASGFKATRDGVADWLKIDDGDSRLKFEYAQERGKPNEYAVRIEVSANQFQPSPTEADRCQPGPRPEPSSGS